jgi:sortase (surface protein transpeptidase)
VSLITVILVVFIFSGADFAYESLQKNIYDAKENNYKQEYAIQKDVNKINQEEIVEKTLKVNQNLKECWQIEIPVIALIAPIDEGTTQEVMKEYVGHFESTNLWKGNIGLAAHNRRFSDKLF